MDGPEATRRTVLGTLGGAALWAVTGCDTAADPGAARPPERTGTAGAGTSSMCVLAPEGSEGPYYVDHNVLRRDIAEGRPGVPLNLRTTVLDVRTCRPIQGAAVEVWHADASAVYTGQLYFDDRVNAAVADGPYARRGAQRTVNDDDMFFPQYGEQSTLTVTGSPGRGYRASIMLGVRR
ncbi:hypothetical protein [Actinomadura sp. 7K507]|uniref:hypothetical protein n=1 Tax=Actinomadura sp. 7K507 TaxID=2530365 RepID=UPI001044F617|nr:hypothetical protein [Actinomadura sp. 7K507]TDC80957.1 hypothetical protein E1285_33715 [Actinomadura sp. 7K507]